MQKKNQANDYEVDRKKHTSISEDDSRTCKKVKNQTSFIQLYRCSLKRAQKKGWN